MVMLSYVLVTGRNHTSGKEINSEIIIIIKKEQNSVRKNLAWGDFSQK